VQVRYLRERCVGWTIDRAQWKGKRNFKLTRADGGDEAVEAFTQGNVMTNITQRGKRVVFHTERGLMSSHLMFRGRWSVEGDPFISNYKHHREPPEARSRAVSLINTKGASLNLYTPEWMAYVEAYPAVHDPQTLEELTKLGPETLVLEETDPAFAEPSWTLDRFRAKAGGSRQAIKLFLLDQKKQSGLGNMYVCEALYQAGIDPARKAKTLTDGEIDRLHTAAQGVMRRAIETGLDYDAVLQIYRRQRDPQGRVVEETTMGGRDTFWVPDVQR
ncbi:MAG: DNA-formamidopyrimidine glycosylase family protein, partial [Myxococcota bacterium]